MLNLGKKGADTCCTVEWNKWFAQSTNYCNL